MPPVSHTTVGGALHTSFFDDTGNNVTDQCETRNVCADGSPIVRCLRDPCEGTTCPAFPNAVCRSNYCGGCNFNYTDADGRDVTRQCARCELC